MTSIELSNGLTIPQIGIGTFTLSGEEALESVYWALNIGYRLIDTANAYGNERSVGKAIDNSYIDIDDIFVSTKLWPTEYENENAIDETLERLGIEYIDLLFLHQPAGNYIAGYKLLEKAYKEGKIKAIGLSNFEGKYLDEILSICEIEPHVLQVEAHPYYTQEELRKILEEHGIKLMSWYPLGHGDQSLMDEPVLKELALKYKKTSAQIILRWHIQMGFIVIPGSKNNAHIKENFDIFDFKLDDDDMKQISSLNRNERYYNLSQKNLDNFVKFKPKYEK